MSDGGCFDFAGELTLSMLSDGGFGANLTVDTSAPAEDDDRGACVIGGGAGRDVFLHLSLSAPQLVSLSLQPLDGGDGVLSVRPAACNAATAVACADEAGAGGAERLDRVLLGAGDYYVVVDNYAHLNNGRAIISADVEPAPGVPVNDDCAGAFPLAFVGGSAAVTGDTTAASDSAGDAGMPFCSYSAITTGRDLAYAVTVPAGPPQDLSVTVTALSAGFDPVLSIAGTCDGIGADGGSSELGCVAGAGAALTRTSLPPGQYFVWVDGRQDTVGAFALAATLTPAAVVVTNDLCNNAQRVLSMGTTEQISGVTRGNADNSTASCAWGVGNEVYYRFTTTDSQRLTATVTPGASSGYRPALYVVPTSFCQPDGGLSTGGRAGCAVASSTEAVLPFEISSLDAGDWLLVVDGVAASEGPFMLDLARSAVAGGASNDTCAAATPFGFSATAWGQFARLTGTTAAAGNDHLGDAGCATAGRDVAYTFTTPDAGGLDGAVFNVKVSVWSNNVVESAPSVFVERSCAGGNVGCRDPAFGPAALSLRDLPGSTSFVVWVDEGDGGAGGPFTAQVEVASVVPPNDTCAGAIDLPLASSVEGSTLGATPDYRGFTPDAGLYTGAWLCTDEFAAAEVVYSFTTTTAGTYVVRVHPDATFDPGLAVTRACTKGSCVDAMDLGLSGDDEVVVLNSEANTTYFLFVDGYSDLAPTARGGFVVSVEAPCNGGYCYSCATSAQCPLGAACVNGTCEACTSRSQCGATQACVVDACGPCQNDGQCDDGNACTVADSCGGGACRNTHPWEYTLTQANVYAGLSASYANLTDTDSLTGGATYSGGPIQATFAAPVTVSAVTVGGGWLIGWGSIATYLNGRSLQYSLDGTNWITAVAAFSGLTDFGPSRFGRFPLATPITARYWRLFYNGYLATSTWTFEITDAFCSDLAACTSSASCESTSRICRGGTCARCADSSECTAQRACLGGACSVCTASGQCDMGAQCPGFTCAGGLCTPPWEYLATESAIFGNLSAPEGPGMVATYAKLTDTLSTTGAGANRAGPADTFLLATFPAAVTVDAVIVGGGVVNGGLQPTQAMLNGRAIQYSLDGTTWVTAVASISGISDTPGPSLLKRYPIVPSVTARFWRLQVPQFNWLAASTFAFELADNFSCVTTRACGADLDCPGGLVCVSGTCQTCSTTAHCAGTSRGACLNHVCLPCTSSAQCGGGGCDAGICL